MGFATMDKDNISYDENSTEKATDFVKEWLDTIEKGHLKLSRPAMAAIVMVVDYLNLVNSGMRGETKEKEAAQKMKILTSNLNCFSINEQNLSGALFNHPSTESIVKALFGIEIKG